MVNWKETKCGKCKIQRGRPVCNSCFSYDKFIPIAITNADRIRSMSDEEFAEFWLKSCDNPIMIYNEDICYLCDIYEGSVQCDGEYCKKAIVKWLQSEVEE